MATNREVFSSQIIDAFLELGDACAVINGIPRQCGPWNCEDCDFNDGGDCCNCYSKFKRWLGKEHHPFGWLDEYVGCKAEVWFTDGKHEKGGLKKNKATPMFELHTGCGVFLFPESQVARVKVMTE